MPAFENDTATMTPEQRFQEVAAILARGAIPPALGLGYGDGLLSAGRLAGPGRGACWRAE